MKNALYIDSIGFPPPRLVTLVVRDRWGAEILATDGQYQRKEQSSIEANCGARAVANIIRLSRAKNPMRTFVLLS